jgi:hypothetical protein
MDIKRMKAYQILGGSPIFIEKDKTPEFQFVGGNLLINGEIASIYSHSRFQTIKSFVEEAEKNERIFILN